VGAALVIFRWDKKEEGGRGGLRFPLSQVDQTLLAGQTTKQEAVILGLEDQNISKPLLETLSFIQVYNTEQAAKWTSLSSYAGWSDLSEGHWSGDVWGPGHALRFYRSHWNHASQRTRRQVNPWIFV